MDPRLIVLLGGVYTEEAEDEDKDERIIEGEGNGFGRGEGNGFGGGGWGWAWGWERPCDESAGIAAIDIASAEETKATCWEEIILAASLYLYFSISALIAFSSACKVWTCCCKADIAPMHPYTGSLILKLAS